MERLTISVVDGVTVTVEGADVKDIIRRAAFWSGLPRTCPLCNNGLTFTYRTPQDHEYFGMKCLGNPAHEVNFGVHKDTNRGLYYKDEWADAFSSRTNSGDNQGTRTGPAVSIL